MTTTAGDLPKMMTWLEPVQFASHLAARDYVLERLAQWLMLQLGVQVQDTADDAPEAKDAP